MVFIPALHCAVANVIGLVNGRTVSFGLNCRHVGGAYLQADIDALAAAVDSWAGVHLLPKLTVDAAYVNTRVRGLTSETDLEGDNDDSAGAGSDGGEALPNNVSFVISHRTGFTGRVARGRTYMWGVPATALDANEDVVTGTFAGDAVSVFIELLTELPAVDWEHVVVSRYHLGVPRTTASILTVTNYLAVDLGVDTRRKRLG